jgi:tetratricopeptide (TPR) repeat protein
VFSDYSVAQNENKALLFQRFLEQYKAGDLLSAEATLYLFLDSKIPLTNDQLSAAFGNLGAIDILLGKYDKALEYNEKAEILVSNKNLNNKVLANIYSNRARLYTLEKSYNSAIEYFEKSLRLYSELNDPDRNDIMNFSSAYLNIGIAYYCINDFQIALK